MVPQQVQAGAAAHLPQAQRRRPCARAISMKPPRNTAERIASLVCGGFLSQVERVCGQAAPPSAGVVKRLRIPVQPGVTG